jgi:hypothetical protein
MHSVSTGPRAADQSLPCAGKTRYESEFVARRCLTRTQSHKAGVVKMPTRCFECPHCHGWHLTSKPARESVEMIYEALGLKAV